MLDNVVFFVVSRKNNPNCKVNKKRVLWKIPGDRLCIVAESWVESKNKNIKNSLGATCPKDKNRSPFTAKNP